MTLEEIKTQYGFEPIMKEMYVWDNIKIVTKQFVIGFIPKNNYGYLAIREKEYVNFYNHASETDPNNIQW